MATTFDQEACLEKIFHVFDKDDSGFLEVGEITAFAQAFAEQPHQPPHRHKHDKKKQAETAKVSDHLVENLVEVMDWNKADRKISLAEFSAFLQSLILVKFDQYDTHKDGELTIDEMVEVVADLCHSARDESDRKKDKHYVQKKKEWFMKKFDTDKGGSVSPYEFQAFFLQQIAEALEHFCVGHKMPYMLARLVETNPAHATKMVKKIQQTEAKRAAKNHAAGVVPHESEAQPVVSAAEAFAPHAQVGAMKAFKPPVKSAVERANEAELQRKAAAKEEEKKHAVEIAARKIHETAEKKKLQHDAIAMRHEEEAKRKAATEKWMEDLIKANEQVVHKPPAQVAKPAAQAQPPEEKGVCEACVIA